VGCRCRLELRQRRGKSGYGGLLGSLYRAKSPDRVVESSRILSTTESRIDSRVCCGFRFFLRFSPLGISHFMLFSILLGVGLACPQSFGSTTRTEAKPAGVSEVRQRHDSTGVDSWSSNTTAGRGNELG
jgi:hypothetical protein